MYQLENDYLSVSIQSKGAELQGIFGKQTGMEYLWNADPAFWAKTSPVLFPIVGTLKNDTYYYEGKSYHLSRHGFARETEFTVTQESSQRIIFTLTSNAETLQKFPFQFTFNIIYSLSGSTLKVDYEVHNTGNSKMYFSLGAHPAFKLPLKDGLQYEDYYLEFSDTENAGRWPISKEGLIEAEPISLLNNTSSLQLSKALFENDALVFKRLRSDKLQLKSVKDKHGLTFSVHQFPYLGLWAAKNANFLCIEPWCGIADSVHTNQQLTDKEGIELLKEGELFTRAWSVTLF